MISWFCKLWGTRTSRFFYRYLNQWFNFFRRRGGTWTRDYRTILRSECGSMRIYCIVLLWAPLSTSYWGPNHSVRIQRDSYARSIFCRLCRVRTHDLRGRFLNTLRQDISLFCWRLFISCLRYSSSNQRGSPSLSRRRRLVWFSSRSSCGRRSSLGCWWWFQR